MGEQYFITPMAGLRCIVSAMGFLSADVYVSADAFGDEYEALNEANEALAMDNSVDEALNEANEGFSLDIGTSGLSVNIYFHIVEDKLLMHEKKSTTAGIDAALVFQDEFPEVSTTVGTDAALDSPDEFSA